MSPPVKRPVWLWIGMAAVCVAASVGGHRLVVEVEQAFDLSYGEAHLAIDSAVFLALLLTYCVLLALPFVPGAELGILLLIVCGPEAAIPVYGATVVGLVTSFGVGRLVPEPRLVDGLRRLGLVRAARLIAAGQAEPAGAGIGQAPTPSGGWMIASVLRHRCIALGLVLNAPGNAVLGGGGGIALAVGASRLLTVPQFLATVLVAVAPVPGAILIAAMVTSN